MNRRQVPKAYPTAGQRSFQRFYFSSQTQKPFVPIAQPRTACLGNLQPKVGVAQSSCHTSLPYGLSSSAGREFDQFIAGYALALPPRDR